MSKIRSFVLASACLVLVVFPLPSSAQFAGSVVSYTSGSGVGSGYNDPTHSLGSPTTFIGYQDTDPFNPPFLGEHLVSVGAGGSLTVQFSSPILNDPGHLFGLDFNIFGNTGFVITNGDYSGGGITDGSLFSHNTGATRVWVSADNLNYYLLNPSFAPVVDGLAPTDAAGDFTRSINPVLTQNDFAGRGLPGIRSLYDGSGGGTGYDISWAQDSSGANVFLSSISYVRVDVLTGKSEIDALVAVPEPGLGALAIGALAAWIARRRFATSARHSQ